MAKFSIGQKLQFPQGWYQEIRMGDILEISSINEDLNKYYLILKPKVGEDRYKLEAWFDIPYLDIDWKNDEPDSYPILIH